MRRLLALALAGGLLFASAAPLAAAPPTISGTITLDTAVPTYQQPVTFTTTVTGHLKGYQYPMVYVACSQEVFVYGELNFPYVGFILGGGSSIWTERGGGDAECTATLYIYPGLHNDAIIFLDSVAFHAEG